MAAACAMRPGTLALVLLVIDSSVLVGLLRGGRLASLRMARLEALPLLVAALVLQLLLGLPLRHVHGARWGIGSVLLVASMLLLLLVARANRLLPGMPLLAVGLGVNLLVVGLNGAMPVLTAVPQWTHIHTTSVNASRLGPQYVLAGPKTRRPMLGEWVGFLNLRAGASIGDLIQYAGPFVFIQGLMVWGAARRPKLKPPRSPWATLLRVAWLAILLGLLLQLALLLVAAGFGTVAGSRPLLAETCKTVCWSLLVCVGVALGRVAAKARVPLEGVTGLLAAPLALAAANTLQKGVAEALNAAGTPAGPPPLWVLAIKAAEYACLGLALGWIGRRPWGSALGHTAAGLVIGVVFGGAFLALTVASAHPALPSLLAKGVNELLFPVGCALVVFFAEVLATHLGPPRQTTSTPGSASPTPASKPRSPSLSASAPARSPSRSARRVGWNAATGYASPTAAASPPDAPWTAIAASASTAWRGWAVLGPRPRTATPRTRRSPPVATHAPARTLLPLAKGGQLGHRRSA
jgi:hypothetical protein